MDFLLTLSPATLTLGATLILLLAFLWVAVGLAMRLQRLRALLEANQGNSDRLERALRNDLSAQRLENADSLRQNREELLNNLQRFADQQSLQITHLTQRNADGLETLRQTVEGKLAAIQDSNEKKLEKIRLTVDEKLHETLEKRLNASFQSVREQLESVHKGLGEMQALANGVGDLKKVLTNVKTRGTWGEVQLSQLLEQFLSPGQYVTNCVTRPGSRERVEYAICLPGRDEGATPVLLPIDAKFPLEDFQRLIEAQEAGDATAAELAGKALESRIRTEARSLRDKYLEPPHTTDFGLLFLPIEGLWAEVIRRPGLVDELQRDYRVTISGPTTLVALLNSLQMGFRTLAIEKRSSEVWKVLGEVKTEFGKFGGILDKTKRKLDEARNTLDSAAQRTRVMNRKLETVQEEPRGEHAALPSDHEEESEDEAGEDAG